nr:exopolysaccharide biosynthesis protein [Aureimonas leprariae]
MAADETRARVSVADLVMALQDRAFGALMLIFAIPNALPAIPGTSAILGAPLVILAAQLSFGRSPWLPGVIANRSMPRADFETMITRVVPWIQRAEKLLRPRLTVLVRAPSEYLIGIACLLMAIVLFLPIPLGNMLPAIAICFFSLALLEQDGVWALLGLLLTALSIAVLGLMGAFVFEGFSLLFERLFT